MCNEFNTAEFAATRLPPRSKNSRGFALISANAWKYLGSALLVLTGSILACSDIPTSGIVTVVHVTAPNITTTSMATGTVEMPYSHTLAATGGDGNYTWTMFNATTLIAGLVLNAATGEISGTPTAAGTANFEVRVTSVGQTATKALAVTVDTTLVDPPSPPDTTLVDPPPPPVNPSPTIASLSPNSGIPSGGTVVTITGTDFVSGATVTFDGTAATGITFNSSMSLTATTPVHAAGAVDVDVTNPDGQSSSLSAGYTYQVPAPVGPWPDNEPAGLVPVFPGHPTTPGVLLDGSDLHFNYTEQGGSDLGGSFNFGAKWDGVRILRATSGGSKYPEVIRKNMLVGDTHGWNGMAWDDNFPADYETLYFRMIFKYSANWQFNSDGEKFYMFGQANGTGSAFYPGPAGSQRLQFRNQSPNAGDGGIWRSGVRVTVGEWHTLELIVNAQSALGVADGSFRLWWDGVEITDWNWLSGSPDPGQDAIEWFDSSHTTRLFSGLQVPLYWGGQGPPKTVNDHLDLSEFYITGVPAIN